MSLNTLFSRALTVGAMVLTLGISGRAFAQFSQPVVVLKGTVLTQEGGKPISVKVSIRAINDTAQELTASRSNSESGNYLVVLKPSKKYWAHLEGDLIMPKDIMFETPQAQDRTVQMVQNFSVTTREVEITAPVVDKPKD